MKLSIIRRACGKIRGMGFALATIISPTLNTRLRYRYLFKKKLNLKNPITFNEKLLWLKLKKYNFDPLIAQCADKYRVREYVRSCGYENILIDLLGVWDDAKCIPWDELPDSFVLKWNFGAGMNVICKDKKVVDRVTVIKQMCKWGKKKYWLSHSEMHYKHTEKKIVCEKYLPYEEGNAIPDYKIYCFNGKPMAILVMHDRGSDQITIEFFDRNWKRLMNPKGSAAPLRETPQPACLEQMLNAAEILSTPFPFVRCDFYVIGDKFYFGELTFTPAAGMYVYTTEINGKDMSEYLNIN